jgi:MFS family permease
MKPSFSHAAEPWRPVLWLGLLSLLTAIAGEAARSVSGPFLKQLGASAIAVGVIAGAGELLGYTLRLGAGFLADRPGGAWRWLLAGTVLGISAAPLLAVAPGWQVAAALYLMERIGRAVRTPARDVLLSAASDRIGHGPGFGVHRLLDQTGAVIGPLAVAALFSARNGYRTAFAVLFLPSLAGVALLMWVRRRYPDLATPAGPPETLHSSRLPGSFWWLCATAGLLAAGTTDFALISYHLARQGRAGPAEIPVLYAAAMALEGVAATALGFVLHKLGALSLLITIAMSVAAAPLVFLANVPPLSGVAAWSIGMGGQYALLRALVPGRVPPHSRGAAFGWFNTVFGVCWFLGSAAMGVLYAHSLVGLVWFAIASQVATVPLVLRMAYMAKRHRVSSQATN